MKALIIYDATGRVLLISYGEERVPQGVPCLFADIPDGAQVERVDVTDPEHPQVVYTELPDSDIGKLQKEVQGLKELFVTLDGAISDLGEALSAIAEAEFPEEFSEPEPVTASIDSATVTPDATKELKTEGVE